MDIRSIVYFLCFILTDTFCSVVVHRTSNIVSEPELYPAPVVALTSNYFKATEIPEEVRDYFYWNRHQPKWFKCPNGCDCAEDKTTEAADRISISCYSGNMNESNFSSIINDSPVNITSLTIEAPLASPNNFMWNDNLNRFENLRVLRLINCGIPALSYAMNLEQLEVLDLSGNQIQKIKIEMFTALRNLKSIDLSRNKLVAVPTGVFESLNALQNLSLAYNNITGLPDDLLHRKMNFKSLHLDGNKIPIENLNSLFQEIQQIERLELNYCGLQDFRKLNLQELRNIRRIGLAGNMIGEIPVDVLHGLKHLETLDLSNNNIQRFTVDHYWTSNLTRLFLAHNSLTNLEDLKNIANYGPIKELDISYNNFGSFSSHYLGSLQNTIEILDLSGNQLFSIRESHTSNLTALRILHLADNEITNLPYTLPPEFTQLTALNLSQNGIYSLPYSHEQLPALKLLDISRNRFFSLHSQFETFLDHLDEVYLYNNPWDCGCNTDILKRHMNKRYSNRRKLRYEETKCMTPESLRGTAILNLNQVTDCAVLFGARYGFTQATELGVLVALLLAITLLVSLCILFVYYKREQRQKISYMDPHRSHSRTVLTTQMNRSCSSTTEPLTSDTNIGISTKFSQNIPPPPPPPLLTAY